MLPAALLCAVLAPACQPPPATRQPPEPTPLEPTPPPQDPVPECTGSALQVAQDGVITRKTCTQLASSSYHPYRLELDGPLDMENTRLRAYDRIDVAFQPDLELTLENVGDTSIRNPRIVLNGQRGWATMEDMLEALSAGADSDQDLAFRLWENIRANRYHQMPLFENLEPADPVKLLNVYGFNLCGQAAFVTSALLQAAGLEGSYTRGLLGHMVAEAWIDGRAQVLDTDQGSFYLDRENEVPVSGDACARDADLVRRELNYGPVVDQFYDGSLAAGLYGPDDQKDPSVFIGHSLAFSLRPGERISFRWDAAGHYASERPDTAAPPTYYGNSFFRYRPRLDPASVAVDALEALELAPGTTPDPACTLSGGTNGALVYEVRSPWLIAGGTARATFYGLEAADRFGIDVSTDGQTWTPVWSGAGAGSIGTEAVLDEALDLFHDPAEYRYLVRIRLESASAARGANLCGLELETPVMAAPFSLPRLSRGANLAEYRDDNEAPGQLRITHTWQERQDLLPPDPPVAPVTPIDGAVVRTSVVDFAWPAVEGAARYHLRVSRRPDLAYPYRPSLDVVIPTTTWSVPFTGLFSPDTVYYWALRTLSAEGVWSDWSDTWTFTWDGPRVPVDVRLELEGRTAVLRWSPNPRGAAPVRYAVFASEEQGFTPHREAYYQDLRGTVPANLVGETDGTSMTVIGEGAPSIQMKAFYRVVAIDAAGTESGPSDYAEAPHPFVVGALPAATAGVPYAYIAASIASIGSLQYVDGYWGWYDAEVIRWAMLEGPGWLAVDPATGELSGTPAAGDAGDFRVTLQACNQWDRCDVLEQPLTVSAASP